MYIEIYTTSNPGAPWHPDETNAVVGTYLPGWRPDPEEGIMNPVSSISSLDLIVIVVFMVGVLAAGLLAASG